MIPEDIIIKHITNVYGFKVTPCSMPRNSWQSIKHDLYILLKGTNSRSGIYNEHTNYEYSTVINLRYRIFKFLMKKFPIKFFDKRPDGSIWFEKRNSDRRLEYELSFKPVPPEVARLEKNMNGILVARDKGNYSVDLYTTELPKFFINVYDLPDAITRIDSNFSKVAELKQLLRNHKLSTIN